MIYESYGCEQKFTLCVLGTVHVCVGKCTHISLCTHKQAPVCGLEELFIGTRTSLPFRFLIANDSPFENKTILILLSNTDRRYKGPAQIEEKVINIGSI